jgi:AcrR family transcriptional regulator
MGRGHEAALAGTVRAVAKYGSRATMGDIALIAGIAKATLYNHFRTRDELYAAVLISEVNSIGDAAAQAAAAVGGEAAARGTAALAEAARLIATNPAVRKIAAEEPAVSALLSRPAGGPAWELAGHQVVRVITAAGIAITPAGVDVVVRYLASQLSAPTPDTLRIDGAALLVAGLLNFPAAAAQPSPGPAPADSADTSS